MATTLQSIIAKAALDVTSPIQLSNLLETTLLGVSLGLFYLYTVTPTPAKAAILSASARANLSAAQDRESQTLPTSNRSIASKSAVKENSPDSLSEPRMATRPAYSKAHQSAESRQVSYKSGGGRHRGWLSKKLAWQQLARKVTLGLVFAIMCTMVGLTFYSNYTRNVTRFGDPKALLVITPLMKYGVVLSSLVITLTHTQYYHILYKLSLGFHFNRTGVLILVGTMLGVDCLDVSLAVFLSTRIAAMKSIYPINTKPFKAPSIALAALFLTNQMILAVSMAYLLSREQPISQNIRQILRRILFLIISSGGICVVLTSFELWLLVSAPEDLIWSTLPLNILPFTCVIGLLLLLLNPSRSAMQPVDTVVHIHTEVHKSSALS